MDNSDKEKNNALPLKLVVWKVNKASIRIASVRYRCMLPAVGLIDLGYNSLIIEKGEELRSFVGVNAIVFVKTFSNEDLILASQANTAGVLVVIDLCDNIFVPGYGGEIYEKNWGCFYSIAALAKVVVTTNYGLADLIKRKVPKLNKVNVIYDQLETKDDLNILSERLPEWRRHPLIKLHSYNLNIRDATNRLRLEANSDLMGSACKKMAQKIIPIVGGVAIIKHCFLNYGSLHKRIRDVFQRVLLGVGQLLQGMWKSVTRKKEDVSSDVGEYLNNRFSRYISTGVASNTQRSLLKKTKLKKVIWFGNQGLSQSKNGSNYSSFGMRSILLIEKELVNLYGEFEFELLVVSKSESMYVELIKPINIPTSYRSWDPVKIFREISESSVCIIPNSLDEFSIFKSPNRALLSLSLGTPVVATRIPSFEPLSDCIIFDEWVSGISTYLNDDVRTYRDVQAGRDIISRSYSKYSISESWSIILTDNVIDNDVQSLQYGRELKQKEVGHEVY